MSRQARLSRTKKRVYGALLAIMAVGLFVDQVLIGDPQAARASAVEGLTLVDQLIGESDSAGSTQDMPRQFPEDLKEIRWTGPIPNPFVPPPEIIRRQAQIQAGKIQKTSPTTVRRPGEPPGVEDFVTAHRLKGVYVGQSAIVDGRLVQIGTKIDSAELLKVEGNTAHFRCRDGTAVLLLDRRH